jgi:hypothetical protein
MDGFGIGFICVVIEYCNMRLSMNVAVYFFHQFCYVAKVVMISLYMMMIWEVSHEKSEMLCANLLSWF